MEQEGRKTDLYDVIIVGAGPAGATAAIYTARAGLGTLILDKGLRTGAMGMAAKICSIGCNNLTALSRAYMSQAVSIDIRIRANFNLCI